MSSGSTRAKTVALVAAPIRNDGHRIHINERYCMSGLLLHWNNLFWGLWSRRLCLLGDNQPAFDATICDGLVACILKRQHDGDDTPNDGYGRSRHDYPGPGLAPPWATVLISGQAGFFYLGRH